jgi:hypothetical protein
MHAKPSQLKFQKSIPNTALFDIAPLLAAAALTGFAELVTAGILFANASKTLKTLIPPQTVLLSPEQG